jgi:AraC-like DNA-binding protein
MNIDVLELKAEFHPQKNNGVFLCCDGKIECHNQALSQKYHGPHLIAGSPFECIKWEGQLAYFITGFSEQDQGFWRLTDFHLSLLEFFGDDQVHSKKTLNFLFSHISISQTKSISPTSITASSAHSKPPKKEHNLVLEIEQYFNKHLTDKITLKEVADHHQVSLVTLHNAFKKENKGTPMSILMNLRMQHAKKLVEASEVPFKQIATEVGMGDSTSFSRRYKKEFGRSPREARKQAQWLC